MFLALTVVLGSFSVMVKGDPGLKADDSKDAMAKAASEAAGPTKQGRPQAASADPAASYPRGLLPSAPNDIYDVGDSASYRVGEYGKWSYNDTNPSDFMPFTKRAEGSNCELWVCDDLTFLPGDERNNLSASLTITDEQAAHMVQQFDQVVYQNLTRLVSAAPPKDGENSVPKAEGLPYFGTNVTGRVMIMVFNIVDSDFFAPVHEGWTYGFFDPSIDNYYDRNIINLDCWDWNNYTGIQAPTPTGNHSYYYESGLAHEYQHLLNYGANPDQVAFVNEGGSALASLLCGYPIDSQKIERFLTTPDNSLTEWDDQTYINEAADYGAAYLFSFWLYDHFGLDFSHALLNSPLNGTEAIDQAFTATDHSDWNFQKAFSAWRLANLIHADTPGAGLYNYKSIDLNDGSYGSLRVLSWDPTTDPQVASAASFFGKSYIEPLDYYLDTTKLSSYGTDYIRVGGSHKGISDWSTGLDPSSLDFGFTGQSDIPKGWQIVDKPISIVDPVFSDDFNHGGAMPGWATLSMGEMAQPWHTELRQGDDYFIISSADEAGPGVAVRYERVYMTHGFSTVGMTDLGLGVTVDYQNYFTNDIGRILYSIDGGSSWRELTNFTQDTNERGSPMEYNTSLILDFSAACGYSDVRLAFEYYTEDWAWYFAVDNIKVGQVVKERMWWSDSGDLVDYSLVADLDLKGMDHAILSFDTEWAIESTWDFGFVQVSNDSGTTWTSLSNDYTTYDAGFGAYPAIVENLPGITGSSPSVGMMSMSFDLGQWAGQDILLRFRYMTDWILSLSGWYIDNIRLNGVLLDDASSHLLFQPSPAYAKADWLVSFYLPGCYDDHGIWLLPLVVNLRIDGQTDQIKRFMGTLTDWREMYIIVSPTAGPSDYGFWMESMDNPA